ncbi:hypothetical protein [Micromonospora echinofusca]|uniref:hypothetical protein n=1 Tax=Micromonospora echinofusca TaxID=47858 RepID=UPI000B5AC514|nr:hypothetical protein [Micromonospora echinofusca]
MSAGDLGEEHSQRVLRGKGDKVLFLLVPLPPAVARALDRAWTTVTVELTGADLTAVRQWLRQRDEVG